MNLNKYDIKYDRAVLSWDEALPMGNGRMGCLLYGGKCNDGNRIEVTL